MPCKVEKTNRQSKIDDTIRETLALIKKIGKNRKMVEEIIGVKLAPTVYPNGFVHYFLHGAYLFILLCFFNLFSNTFITADLQVVKSLFAFLPPHPTLSVLLYLSNQMAPPFPLSLPLPSPYTSIPPPTLCYIPIKLHPSLHLSIHLSLLHRMEKQLGSS